MAASRSGLGLLAAVAVGACTPCKDVACRNRPAQFTFTGLDAEAVSVNGTVAWGGEPLAFECDGFECVIDEDGAWSVERDASGLHFETFDGVPDTEFRIEVIVEDDASELTFVPRVDTVFPFGEECQECTEIDEARELP